MAKHTKDGLRRDYEVSLKVGLITPKTVVALGADPDTMEGLQAIADHVDAIATEHEKTRYRCHYSRSLAKR